MRPPLDFDALRRRMEAQTGVLCGFTNDHERARFPYTVTLEGLSPGTLGYCMFGDILHDCVHVAVELAPLKFRHDAYYEHHKRIGYRFIFEDQTTAIKFAFHYKVAHLSISIKITGPRLVTLDGEAAPQDMT